MPNPPLVCGKGKPQQKTEEAMYGDSRVIQGKLTDHMKRNSHLPHLEPNPSQPPVGPHRPYAIEGPFEPLSTWTQDFLGSKLVCKGT